MFKKLSLKYKIFMIIIPLGMALIGTSLLVISDYHRQGKQMNGLADVVDLFDAFSKLVNGLQVERGKTAQYFTQKLTLNELQGHRFLNVDKQIIEARKMLTVLPFSSADVSSTQLNFDKIAGLRKKIDSHEIAFTEAFEEYSAIIHKIIVLGGVSTSLFSRSGARPGIEQRLSNLIIVETLKESMGQTRATYSEVFGKNEPLYFQKLNRIESIRTGIKAIANSPSLEQMPLVHKKIQKLMTSAEWKSITKDLDTVMLKANKGEYGVDSKVFFKKISDVIESISNILKSEREAILHLAHHEAAKANRIFDLVSIAMLVLVSSLIIFSGMISSALFEETKEKRRSEILLLEAKQSAEVANRAKSSFLANMGHEIRTPLHSIIGYADILRGTQLQEDQYKFVNSIKDAGDLLLSHINDLLDFSKIEAGKLELEVVDFNLRKIVQDVVELSKPLAVKKKLTLSCQFDPAVPNFVQGDSLRLKQILLNLVSNSLKFTEAGFIIVRVSASDLGQDNVHLHFEIEDSGIGMTPKEMENIFRPFTQADASSTRRFGGTGLGLSICRHLTELMGGTIYPKSTLGKGTSFFLEITLKRMDDISKSEHESVPNCEARKLDILLAEDNIVNQEMMRLMLEHMGHKVDVVCNGNEALEILDKASYDLIFMDNQMPIMDGLESTRRIRALGGNFKNIPIIALTASASAESMKKCNEAGMNDFRAKPVHIELLKETILRWSEKGEGKRLGNHLSF